MRDSSSRTYRDTLRAVGERADDAVSKVYEDLQNNLKSIAGVSGDARRTLAKRIDALYDVCKFCDVTCRRHRECVGILELSSIYVPRPDRKVEAALQLLERNFSFSRSESVSLLEKAVTWGIPHAVGNDPKKLRFLAALAQGGDKDFLKTVLDAYRARQGKTDVRDKCGYSLGSSEYLQWIEKQVFLKPLPSYRSGEDYARILREALERIAKQL